MARDYTASNTNQIYAGIGIDQNNAPLHMQILVDGFYTFVSDLRKRVNANENATAKLPTSKREFILNSITDWLTMFDRYDTNLQLSSVQKDEKTGYDYFLITSDNEDNQDREWTQEDVGTEAFSKEFELTVGFPVTGIPNPAVWQFYQKALAMQSTIDSMRKAKSNSATWYIVFADGKDWLFKATDQSASEVCKAFQSYLNSD